MSSNISYLNWLYKEYVKEYEHILTYVYSYCEIWASSPYFKYLNLFAQDIYNIFKENEQETLYVSNYINDKINILKSVKLFITERLNDINEIETQYMIREHIIDNIIIYYPFENTPNINILMNNNYLLYSDFFMSYIKLINLIISISYETCYILYIEHNYYKTCLEILYKIIIDVKEINNFCLIPNVMKTEYIGSI